MEVNKIMRSVYHCFWMPVARVIAIHPVATCGEANRWQKEAYGNTIWLHHARVRMQVYERARVIRTYYTLRLAYESARGHARRDG